MNAERWIALKELFARALELDPEGLETSLDGVKADDADLHADLEALLTADSETTQVVDGDPGLMMEAGAEDTGGADEGDARVESRIGPWAVTERLGEGGMGVVYRADRADGTYEQSVALKVLRRGMDTEGILARFRNERQILAGLEHPNIARLVDGGMTDDGLPWFMSLEAPWRRLESTVGRRHGRTGQPTTPLRSH